MFSRTRLRLTLFYCVLFALVLAAFSIVFYVVLATALSPTFDVDPDLSNEQAAQVAYQATLEQVRVALVAADFAMVGLVGVAAWVLATRTLRPIRVAYERQRRFVADASHEMRTPLAAIRASAEGALVGEGSADELRRALTIVVGSTDRLTRLTNDLLTLARADELPDGEAAPIDLSVVVAETLEAFALAHPDAQRPMTRLAEDLPVTADADEIGRIVANLLDNAYRYGAERGAPRVTTRRAEREAVVEVGDDGPGIPPADLERVFEPFARLNPTADRAPGSGLGLAIARSLALRNGGHLTVRSRPSEGATFRLSLPLTR